jgi:hypothetical protein
MNALKFLTFMEKITKEERNGYVVIEHMNNEYIHEPAVCREGAPAFYTYTDHNCVQMFFHES